MKSLRVSAFADEIDKNFEIQIRELKKHGLHHIELRGINGKSFVDYSLDELRVFKNMLDEAGIRVSSLGSPLGKSDLTEDLQIFLDRADYIIDIAKLFETQYIRMFSIWMPKDEDPSIHREEVLSRLREAVKLAEKREVIFLHENEKAIYGDTPERCLDILKTINSPNLRAVYDPANFVQCNCDPKEAFDLVKDYVVYMHIKDADRESQENVPAGKGDGQIPLILKTLLAGGYDGFISLEPHLALFEGLLSLENDTKVAKDNQNKCIQMFGVAVDALDDILKKIDCERV